MSDPNDLTQQMLDLANAGVKSVTTDGITTEATNPKDLIALDQYLAQKVAMTRRNRGMRFSKLIPAGAASQNNLSDSFDSNPGQ